MTPQHTNPPDRMDFNLKVWELVRQIPPGKVASYGQIAELIPPPGGMEARSYRAFGALGRRRYGSLSRRCALAACGQQQRRDQPAARGDLRQRELLEAEGVVFSERGRIDLKRFRWAGPGEQEPPDWVQPSFDDLL